jgi:hypothetical protein
MDARRSITPASGAPVPAEAYIVATLLRRCRRAVTVDYRDVQEIHTMKHQHGSLEDRIETAIRLPPAEGAPDRVDFSIECATLGGAPQLCAQLRADLV